MSQIIETQSNQHPNNIESHTIPETSPINTNPQTPIIQSLVPESPVILIEKDPSLKIPTSEQNPALIIDKKITEKKKIIIFISFPNRKITKCNI